MGQRTVTGTIYRPGGNVAWPNAEVWFMLVDNQMDQANDRTYPASNHKTITDAAGQLSTAIFVPDDELLTVPYDIYLPGQDIPTRINLGAGPSVDLTDLLISEQLPLTGEGITVGGISISVPADESRSLRFIDAADSGELAAITYDPVAQTLNITTAVGDVLINGNPIGSPQPSIPEFRARLSMNYKEEGIESFSYNYRPGSSISGDLSLSRTTTGTYHLTNQDFNLSTIFNYSGPLMFLIKDTFSNQIVEVSVSRVFNSPALEIRTRQLIGQTVDWDGGFDLVLYGE